MKDGLILVDIQNDYFHGGRMELVGMDEACTKTQRLLDVFRAKKWPVIYMQHIAGSDRATFFLPDTAGADLHNRIRPMPDERIIEKHYPNSFRDTDLLETLHAAGVDRLVICGAMTHMCIDATTRAAADHRFKCVVVHDACATRDLMFEGKTIPAKVVHGAFMAALGAAYANVIGCDEFIKRLNNN